MTIDELKKKCIREGRSLQWLLTVLAEEEVLSRARAGSFSDRLVVKGGYVLQSLGKVPAPLLPKLELEVYSSDEDQFLMEIKEERESSYVHIKDVGEASPCLFALKAMVDGIPVTFYMDITFREGEPAGGCGCELLRLSGEGEPFPLKYMYPEAIFMDCFREVMEKKEILDSMETWYDMFYISIALSPEGRRLGEYLEDSFSPDPEDVFGELKKMKSLSHRWRAFAREYRLPLREFADLADHLTSVIGPVIKAAASGEEFFGVWMPELCRYID
ncbi:MAG: hypothetical protein IK152_09270 [Lachnospiraceae bacterium]|nr:hypothetical protein [Lachnospiraceae bacterium]